MPLSDLQIRKAKQKDKPYRLIDGWGLHLAVKPSGSKLWQLRYRFMGREKLLSLGRYPIVSLADARKKRDEAKRLLDEGIDPSVQKKLDSIDAHVKARMTFKEVADEYYETLVDRGLADAMHVQLPKVRHPEVNLDQERLCQMPKNDGLQSLGKDGV